MWVAEINMCEALMPVSFSARAFAASSNARGMWQLSTTTMATFVLPSSNTSARACNGSAALCAMVRPKLPISRTGHSRGVISAANAPARNAASSGEIMNSKSVQRRIILIII